MRIPDDVEDLVFAFMEPGKKDGLRKMNREEIDALIMAEIGCAVGPGFLEPCCEPGKFPYRVTARGREILQILSPCKRSGR